MKKAYLLSEEDVADLKKGLAEVRGIRGGKMRARLPDEIPASSDVLIVRTPGGGVPAIDTSGSGDGSGLAGTDQPGTARCDAYRRDGNSNELRYAGFSIDCYNLSSSAIAANSWAVAWLDRAGTWVAEPANCGGGSGGCQQLGGEVYFAGGYFGGFAGIGPQFTVLCKLSVVVEVVGVGGQSGVVGTPGLGCSGGGGGGGYAIDLLTLEPGSYTLGIWTTGVATSGLAFFDTDNVTPLVAAENGQDASFRLAIAGTGAATGGRGGDAANAVGRFVSSGGDGGDGRVFGDGHYSSGSGGGAGGISGDGQDGADGVEGVAVLGGEDNGFWATYNGSVGAIRGGMAGDYDTNLATLTPEMYLGCGASALGGILFHVSTGTAIGFIRVTVVEDSDFNAAVGAIYQQNKILNGVGPPSYGTGITGDVYLDMTDTANIKLYYKT